DLYSIGMKTAIHVQASDGPEMRTVTGVEGDVITIDSPLATADPESLIGTHCSMGPENNGLFRMVVDEIDRTRDFGATLTAIPEAHVIFEEMQKVA
uniref:hypothetical protein n=1 Tax=uncultured Paraglaciecola sp. TaxID=1765024 RepID=UPI0026182D8E